MQHAETTALEQVRAALAKTTVSLAVVVRNSGLDYGRIQRMLGGYAQPRPGEMDALLSAISRQERRDRARKTK